MTQRPTKKGITRSSPTRRAFLKQSAFVAGMGVWVASERPLRALQEQSANERINVASIGIGGKGDGDSDQAAKHANLIAFCDVDDKRLDAKCHRYPKAQRFNDFRKMFDKLGKEIDAVTISTPDHTHAVATMMAIKMGKSVYTQKPLAHDVWEARQLRLAAAEHKVASHSGGGDRKREGGSRLDEPSDLAAVTADPKPAARSTGSHVSPLGRMARYRAGSTLRGKVLPPLQLARLAGFWHRRAR
jgi:hypothetical protein